MGYMRLIFLEYCIKSRQPVDCHRDAAFRSRLAHPDLGVVEGGAAIGCDLIGPDQSVDAGATDVSRARPNALGHHHAGLQPSNSSIELDHAVLVADVDEIAADKTQPAGIVGPHLERRPPFLERRSPRSRERRVEEARAGAVTRRKGWQSSAASITGQKSGSTGMSRQGPSRF